MRAGLEYTLILLLVAAMVGGAGAMLFGEDAARGAGYGSAVAPVGS